MAVDLQPRRRGWDPAPVHQGLLRALHHHLVQLRQIVGHDSTTMIDWVYSRQVPQHAAMVKALTGQEEEGIRWASTHS